MDLRPVRPVLSFLRRRRPEPRSDLQQPQHAAEGRQEPLRGIEQAGRDAAVCSRVLPPEMGRGRVEQMQRAVRRKRCSNAQRAMRGNRFERVICLESLVECDKCLIVSSFAASSPPWRTRSVCRKWAISLQQKNRVSPERFAPNGTSVHGDR